MTSGVRDPYFDFIEVKRIGRSSADVYFEIEQFDPGTVIVHTAHRYKLEYRTNVRWFLTAPLAARILEIADRYRPPGKNGYSQ